MEKFLLKRTIGNEVIPHISCKQLVLNISKFSRIIHQFNNEDRFGNKISQFLLSKNLLVNGGHAI